MMFLVLFCFVLVASTGVATKLHIVEDVPPIDPATGLPYGYAKNDIIWSGFESILGDSEPMASSRGTVFTGLVINGTVEHVMAQVEGMGFPIKPLDDAAFDAKITAIEARVQNLDASTPSLWGIHSYERTQNRTRTCRVGGGGPVQREYLTEGVGYLAALGDGLRCSNLPKTCGRISCSWSSGIWWCNGKSFKHRISQVVDSLKFEKLTNVSADNGHMVEYKCNLFAVYARDIHDNCWWDENHIRFAQGEESDNEFKIRVVAGKETAGC
ncbi:hypothetical protein DL766_007435 [Monosporascus sp. MC13-8B]|uniref:Uncharacterized protein n=1 Tax=Monosporascus cannonballus TaxID=155416 RepID=A0ABY0HD10_9PEZI|nr:hypothetical protein DL762_002618 [Monosporascus cannonballus]RYP01578.1 hypothetical protein DL763_000109 [Monosporascus cannonballus]RYP23779.1 hypothetical protein DL766_007435 [Monosporascus sp. MC13-8B]